MRLNTIKPAEGSKASIRRVGRGVGSGMGKTVNFTLSIKSWKI